MCQHKTCATIRANSPAAAGVGAALLLDYQDRKANQSYWVMAVGLEVARKYQGEYNLCAGSLDASDKGCFLAALRRELAEEFKIHIAFQDGSFDRMFKGTNGQLRWFLHYNTPIFVGALSSGFSRQPEVINNFIQKNSKKIMIHGLIIYWSERIQLVSSSGPT